MGIVTIGLDVGQRVDPTAIVVAECESRTIEGKARPEAHRLIRHLERLPALLQTGRLHLPRTREAEQTGKELLNYEIRVDQDANDNYGAFKVGSHDDLVTALGLATQVEPVVAASVTIEAPPDYYRADR